MCDIAIDTYISNKWNEININNKIIGENTWEFCRSLESIGVLVSDKTAISAYSIGPFHLATDLDVEKKDVIKFFFESFIPMIIVNSIGLSFDQAYSVFFIPAISILSEFLNRSFYIKDKLQWKVILFIKLKNQKGIYPSVKDIVEDIEFKQYKTANVRGAIEELISKKNLFGSRKSVIRKDKNRLISCV